MQKFYIVTEFEESYKEGQVYKSAEAALLNKSIEIMKSEYDIKPSSGFLTDAETKKTEYTLIERYDNQFANLNKKVYLLCVDSTNFEKCHVLEFKEIYNLYEYLKYNDNFKLIYNNELEEKTWLNVPIFNTDVIQKYFLHNLDSPKKTKIENINILKNYIQI